MNNVTLLEAAVLSDPFNNTVASALIDALIDETGCSRRTADVHVGRLQQHSQQSLFARRAVELLDERTATGRMYQRSLREWVRLTDRRPHVVHLVSRLIEPQLADAELLLLGQSDTPHKIYVGAQWIVWQHQNRIARTRQRWGNRRTHYYTRLPPGRWFRWDWTWLPLYSSARDSVAPTDPT